MNEILEEKFDKYKSSFFHKEKEYYSKRLMNNTEISIYNRLLKIYKNKYYIFPQVCLGAFIQTTKKEHNQEFHRFPDFLLCDLDYYPIAVIELNGKTHRDDYTHLRDTGLKLILNQSNIPLIQIEIRKQIDDETLTNIIDTTIKKWEYNVNI